MAIISAKGKTEYGELKLRIIGKENIEHIDGGFPFDSNFIRRIIRESDCTIANAYLPEPDSMLKAYLWMCDLFGENNVKVEGELPTIPYEEGVLY